MTLYRLSVQINYAVDQLDPCKIWPVRRIQQVRHRLRAGNHLNPWFQGFKLWSSYSCIFYWPNPTINKLLDSIKLKWISTHKGGCVRKGLVCLLVGLHVCYLLWFGHNSFTCLHYKYRPTCFLGVGSHRTIMSSCRKPKWFKIEFL